MGGARRLRCRLAGRRPGAGPGRAEDVLPFVARRTVGCLLDRLERRRDQGLRPAQGNLQDLLQRRRHGRRRRRLSTRPSPPSPTASPPPRRSPGCGRRRSRPPRRPASRSSSSTPTTSPPAGRPMSAPTSRQAGVTWATLSGRQQAGEGRRQGVPAGRGARRQLPAAGDRRHRQRLRSAGHQIRRRRLRHRSGRHHRQDDRLHGGQQPAGDHRARRFGAPPAVKRVFDNAGVAAGQDPGRRLGQLEGDRRGGEGRLCQCRRLAVSFGAGLHAGGLAGPRRVRRADRLRHPDLQPLRQVERRIRS